jgi:hypothetical protein
MEINEAIKKWKRIRRELRKVVVMLGHEELELKIRLTGTVFEYVQKRPDINELHHASNFLYRSKRILKEQTNGEYKKLLEDLYELLTMLPSPCDGAELSQKELMEIAEQAAERSKAHLG